MTFNSHNIVSGQSGPFVLINVCMYESIRFVLRIYQQTATVDVNARSSLITGGLAAQGCWLGPSVVDRMAASLHSSYEPSELSYGFSLW